MADQEQLRRLKSGVKKWNAWRWGEGRGVEIDLSHANLSGAKLGGADLTGANFRSADLRGVNLFAAHLDATDLSAANLSHAHLIEANLSGANLSGSNLLSAHLGSGYLSNADLSSSKFGYSSLGNLNLSGALGLAKVEHHYPSIVGTRTLERTARGLEREPAKRQGEVETFLRGAGVTEAYLEIFRCQIGMPIEFYSAFISYSHSDKPFARRLYNDLQARGIRCWLDEKDGRIGDPIYEAVNQAIRCNDRVILCCSLASLTSKWVDKELTMTFDKEDQLGQPILLPLDLDGALFEWTSAKAVMVRERIAAKFTGWDKDARLYEERLERVVEAMRPRDDRSG